MKLLLEHGAEVNVKEKCGGTPLHRAIPEGGLGVIQILLDCGANILENMSGLVALAIACEFGQLLRKGVKINTDNFNIDNINFRNEVRQPTWTRIREFLQIHLESPTKLAEIALESYDESVPEPFTIQKRPRCLFNESGIGSKLGMRHMGIGEPQSLFRPTILVSFRT